MRIGATLGTLSSIRGLLSGLHAHPQPSRDESAKEAFGLDVAPGKHVDFYIHMVRSDPPPPSRDLLQGTLNMLILRTLRAGPQHGYGISRSIRAGTHDLLRVETGSLYPALHRLEKRGLIVAEWKTSEHNQRAKYYRLTAKGNRQLSHEELRWTEFVQAIAAFRRSGSQEA